MTLLDNSRDYSFALAWFLIFTGWSIHSALKVDRPLNPIPLIDWILGLSAILIVLLTSISLMRKTSVILERWILGFTFAICVFDLIRLLPRFGVQLMPDRFIGYIESAICLVASLLAVARVYRVVTTGVTPERDSL